MPAAKKEGNAIVELSDLVGNTPMISLKNLSEKLGCTILIKCEWMNGITGSSNDRIAAEIIKIAKNEKQTTLFAEADK